MWSSGRADSILRRIVTEPISPELVLVDPTLALAERGRLLDERDRLPTFADLAALSRLERRRSDAASGAHVRALEAQVKTLRLRIQALEGEVHALEAQASVAGERPSESPRRRRVASVALPMSLVSNAILIAVAVAASRVDQPSSPTTVGVTREE